MANQPATTLLRTALYQAHLAAGARMVPFAGWEMPIQYQGILAETRAVRASVGVFDVSHMGRLRLTGPGAVGLLQRVLTTDVRNLRPGRARYCLFLNRDAGIIDDTIVYRMAEERFLLVPNAANRETVVAWLHQALQAFPDATLEDVTLETVMLAVQGPRAAEVVDSLLPPFHFDGPPSSLRPFTVAEVAMRDDQAVEGPSETHALLARTGYTGEDGFEVIAPSGVGPDLWRRLLDLGTVPCGLGARDVLRLEAGFMLHGTDMDTATTPLEAGLERFVSEANQEFIGREALQRQKNQGVRRKLVGFRLLERGIPRHSYPLLSTEWDGAPRPIGEVTSGGHSPTLDMDIGMGYVAVEHSSPRTRLAVAIRDRIVPAEVVPLPMYSRKK